MNVAIINALRRHAIGESFAGSAAIFRMTGSPGFAETLDRLAETMPVREADTAILDRLAGEARGVAFMAGKRLSAWTRR